MDYSIKAVEGILARHQIPMPETEAEARQLAFEVLLPDDWLAAHSIRLGRYYGEFTDDEWRNVVEVSGERAVRRDIRSLMPCSNRGIIS